MFLLMRYFVDMTEKFEHVLLRRRAVEPRPFTCMQKARHTTYVIKKGVR